MKNIDYHTKKTIRKITDADILEVHFIFSDAFQPYKNNYTPEAYRATVLSPMVMKQRIENSDIEMFVALYNDEIIGTISLRLMKHNKMYICSMAIKPRYQGRGFGQYILEEMIKLAVSRNIYSIILYSFEPLKRAVDFYNQFGFKKTGRKKMYHGIEIFEMVKNI